MDAWDGDAVPVAFFNTGPADDGEGGTMSMEEAEEECCPVDPEDLYDGDDGPNDVAKGWIQFIRG